MPLRRALPSAFVNLPRPHPAGPQLLQARRPVRVARRGQVLQLARRQGAYRVQDSAVQAERTLPQGLLAPVRPLPLQQPLPHPVRAPHSADQEARPRLAGC
jgi:hypothetical protein